MLVLRRVAHAQAAQLRDQQPAQLELARRAGVGAGGVIGLSVDAHVTAEAIEESVHEGVIGACRSRERLVHSSSCPVAILWYAKCDDYCARVGLAARLVVIQGAMVAESTFTDA